MYPTIIKVSYWDEDEGKMRNAVSITLSESFADAADKAERYYGDVQDMNIELFQEDNIINIPVDKYDEVHRWLNEGVY